MFPRERLAVIGDPIAHSLSPAMQMAALERAGLDWIYRAERVAGHELATAVRRFKQEGYRGFNVTIPHKETIGVLLDREDSTAARVGAVNTVVRIDDKFVGFNTDIGGFTAALSSLSPHTDGEAVVFGTGGSARAVAVAVADMGMSVTIVSRDVGRAIALGARVGINVTPLANTEPGLISVLASATLLINATPLGMTHLTGHSPLPEGAYLDPDATVVDLVYGQDTLFLQQARRHGARASDGIEMLIQQGALAFTLWTGFDPDHEAMRAGCIAAIQERTAC